MPKKLVSNGVEGQGSQNQTFACFLYCRARCYKVCPDHYCLLTAGLHVIILFTCITTILHYILLFIIFIIYPLSYKFLDSRNPISAMSTVLSSSCQTLLVLIITHLWYIVGNQHIKLFFCFHPYRNLLLGQTPPSYLAHHHYTWYSFPSSHWYC